MSSYSKELRDAVLRRVLPPQHDSISKVAAEEGISGQTIRNWISKAREAVSTAADVSTQSEKWSSQDKYLIVVETAGMTRSSRSMPVRKGSAPMRSVPGGKSA